jgi:hypothetical protein
MSTKTFTREQKKNLANKISDVENKKDIINICKLIKDDKSFDHKTGVAENDNGVFMYFHKLENETYAKIEKYINAMNDKIISEISSEEVKNYVPYIQDEYELTPDNGQKMKYSNKEKTLLKRQRYDQQTSEELSGN